MTVQIRLLASTKKEAEDTAKALSSLGYSFSPVQTGRKGDFLCYGQIEKLSRKKADDQEVETIEPR